MNEIVKPMSVVRQEFIERIVNDVNNSQLPLFVVEPILQDLLNMVKTAAQKQYESERIQYEQQLQQKDNDNK
jgi:predicted YcjX-like family ATPase